MLSLSAELQLVALIVALYVYDASLLLHGNEGVLTSAGHRWHLGLGATNLRIGGKHLWWPSLLAVHRPIYRMQWNLEAEPVAPPVNAVGTGLAPIKPEASKPTMPKPAKADPVALGLPPPGMFRALGWLTLLLAVLQLLVFPAVLFGWQTDLTVIAALAAIYVTLVAALMVVWSHAASLGLTGRRFAALCFECLVCPPLAINLVRRHSLDMCKSADLVHLASQLLEPDAWQAAQRQLAARVEDQLSLEPENSGRHAALQARLAQLSPRRSATHEYD